MDMRRGKGYPIRNLGIVKKNTAVGMTQMSFLTTVTNHSLSLNLSVFISKL